MANTFKFGAGKWAAKEGSVLAYNDLNNNFKPLPFTFTRASTATRVNESGLIESVASGVPRIDFLDNADGHLLLEPSRTNSLTYSEDFSNAVWVKTNVTVSANSTSSPDGSESADSVVSSASNVAHFISTPAFTVSSAASYTTSIFAKYNGTFMQITFGTGQVSGNPRVNFDLQNGVLGSLDTGISASIDSYGNGWYKLTATVTTATTSLNVNFVNIPSSTSSRVQAYEGDGVSGAYLWGAQLEAGSYATSYIPTSGAAVTRAADSYPLSPLLNLRPLNIGNSYTLFFDVDLNTLENNKVFFALSNSAGTLSFTIRNNVGGVRLYDNIWAAYPVANILSDTNKFVLRIDGTSYKIFVSGTSLSGSIATQRNLGYVGSFLGSNTELKVNEFKIYDTALSDSECQSLVS